MPALPLQAARRLTRPFDPRSEHFTPITVKRLEEVLSYTRGVRFGTVITRTVPEMRLIGNPFRRAVKITRRNVVVGNVHYERSMRRELAKLQARGLLPADFNPMKFKAGPRAWGKRRIGTPFVDYPPRVYVEFIVLRELACEYQMPDGTVVPTRKIERYLKPRPDWPIMLRDYEISNILAILLDGKGYLVTQPKRRR